MATVFTTNKVCLLVFFLFYLSFFPLLFLSVSFSLSGKRRPTALTRRRMAGLMCFVIFRPIRTATEISLLPSASFGVLHVISSGTTPSL